MKHRTIGTTWRLGRRVAAATILGALFGACGGPSESGSDPANDVAASSSGSGVTAPPPGAAPAEPDAAPEPAAPSPAPAPDSGAGSAPDSGFAWTPPAGFTSELASAISQQPSYMGGYGGQITNPFPLLEGTAWFSGLQITRTDAVILGNHFGRPSFRFYVDGRSLHSNGLRAEFTGALDYQFRAGDTYNYEFSTYFPADYKNSSWTEWNMFAQFHGPGFPAWGLYTSGGYLHMRPPSAAANQYRIPMPERERWHDFSWTVRWAPDASGYATLVMNGVEVFSYRGATMHAGEPYYYPKFGSYLANNPFTQVTYSTPWIITRM